MQLYKLLAFAPAVLGCLNADTNSCASFIKSQSATASPFCATFTQSVVTATAGLPAWASNCSYKTSMISAECTCHYSGAAQPSTTLATTTRSVTTTTAGGTNPTTTSAGGGGNTCGSASVNQNVGYGASASGGGSGSGTTVTSCSGLSSAISSGGVIKISGLLSGCGILDVKGSTSIIGVGSGSGLTNGGLRLKSVSNVILRNLKFATPPPGGDLVALDKATNVWIDHCEFSSVGLTGDKDDYDGLLDITHASDGVTVSWNKFSNHWKGSLVGHSDSNGSEDTGKLKVTYHHNYWSNVNSRTPSLRFGTGHIYSSCFENVPTSGINSRMGACVRVENNYFLNTQLAIVTDLDSDEEGGAQNLNNVFSGSTTRITKTCSLTPPYSYTQDPASCICALVKSSAGTGVVS